MITAYLETHAGRLAGILGDLVRIPSENRPPGGAERACQEYVAGFLRKLGWDVDVYAPTDVPGIEEHPLYWPGRDYTGRCNVTARRAGRGQGRSLLLSGHVDTVPAGSRPWTRPPFGAVREGNRLYGRGSMDMKAGLAAALWLAEALHAMRIELGGDLLVESVVDEEFGGVNGTLAARLRGHRADAAIICEPTSLRIAPAQRGGRLAHVTLSAPGDIFADQQGGVISQLRCLLDALPAFAAAREAGAPRHPYYEHLAARAPVAVTCVSSGAWGFGEPIAVPVSCRVEIFMQAMPGETREEIDAQFLAWLEETAAGFPARPEVAYPIRWLPASTLTPDAALIRELAESARAVLGREPAVEGMEAPCDMYVFHQMGIPAVLWGARGGNAHAPDEYVELDSALEAAKVLGDFVVRWCRG
ncbi:MAG: M20/M25/M40 family metallo-hydrolase [Bryobacteraceae bacterium]